MTDRPTYTMQGTGGEGRAMRIDAIDRLLPARPSARASTVAATTPMWLRELRRDRREFIV